MRRASFRKVTKIERIKTEFGTLRAVYWAIIESETSRSIGTKHEAITIMGQGATGTAARMFHKPIKLKKLKGDVQHQLQEYDIREAYTRWYVKRFDKVKSRGVVSWTSRGKGFVKCEVTGNTVSVFACNIVGANSAYPELVTNKSLNKGDVIEFVLADMGQYLTASKIRKVA